MTNNEQFEVDKAQLNALMTVIKKITSHEMPILQPHELTSKSILREIQWAIGDLNALDHSDLIDTLNQAIIEIKYFVSIITDRNNQIHALQATNNYQASEIQRLENQVFRDK